MWHNYNYYGRSRVEGKEVEFFCVIGTTCCVTKEMAWYDAKDLTKMSTVTLVHACMHA